MSMRCHISSRKGLFTIERGVSGWAIVRASFLGDNCTLTMHDPRDGSLMTTLNHGHFGVKLHRSTDGGTTWSEIGTPKYPEKPAGYVPTLPVEGVPADWSLKLVWALAPGGADEPGAVWCGTLPGGLFRSDDHGASWELNRPLWDEPLREQWFGGGAESPGIHSICVDPRDSKHVTVGVSCGGVWLTRDGGRTWQLGGAGMRAEFMPPEKQFEPNAQDPHLVAQCAARPDVLWVQHHNGIFRSTDAARSWTEIEHVKPSAFGFAVAVHPRDADTAWFVPAVKDEKRYPADGRVVVNRTRDGGKSFDTLARGLPQAHAYDLVYRHALDIDDGGDCLVMGSTTGTVWISEDQGESWQTVSSNLPPVYAVCFEKGETARR
jgi:photosystem II stability/assembly factor-like uncharacterized protein